MQAYINYLNNFLLKDKTASTKVSTKAGAISGADFRVQAQDISTRKFLLLVKAFEKTFASSFLPILTGKEF